MAYDQKNIFAKILRGEAPCFKVYEDDMTLSFMDVMPQAEGHTLVIPKYPAENIYDLDPEYAGAMAKTVKKIAAAVKTAFDAPGILIAQLNGAAAGQTVFHIHTHVIPRSQGIDLKLHAREMADFEELKKHAEKIKAALQ
ncbi:HIT family protein [Parvibaculum sp.]|uniref:HIT family protein n=1 Tax=Parvibaculum sp. TaxID=2024848 RepID=UPI0027276474|nr:HIT family protein [Parvibaculum sp.]MDO9126645.1 HIT family protein [Parvibaculum sp.]MDP1628368.1 HIT family protein [Parvibaculum sp.]MDP2149913.1 HIT family protein [Parvibaculum sp.]MDP3329481.1 HIT family protein [Parvibaculum sp.]